MLTSTLLWVKFKNNTSATKAALSSSKVIQLNQSNQCSSLSKTAWSKYN
jgi:hypothetical protein